MKQRAGDGRRVCPHRRHGPARGRDGRGQEPGRGVRPLRQRPGDGPFVTINCGAIPKELIESELFGYAEGAFTGAKQRGKIGLIERADGGTLFLDEIGDLSLELQSKLLHVLEKREFLSVGAVEPTRVDVRFISATNVDLARPDRRGRFRRDLYYRLNVAAITCPPCASARRTSCRWPGISSRS
jgi:transcriptional regulator with PAS, ATPase and Fis domain